MKTGIIICSRLGSTRIPGKALIDLDGKPLMQHLIERLPSDLPIVVAVPKEELKQYAFLVKLFKNVGLFAGAPDDPLERMYLAAKKFKFDTIVRVTHDKVFVDKELMHAILSTFEKKKLDYVFTSFSVPGTGCEVISFAALKRAYEKYKNVEFISYAIKSVCMADKIENLAYGYMPNPNVRLLIDYKKDLFMIRSLMACLGRDCTLNEVLQFVDKHPYIMKLNELPALTVYTCVYNGEAYLRQCFDSVVEQRLFDRSEYIIVDDRSTDKTPHIIAEYVARFPKTFRWIRNHKNMGLSASSNIALSYARSDYIVRLDADDFFANRRATVDLLDAIKNSYHDAIVPNNYLGSFKNIQLGREGMHIGGTIFRTRAINHIKFDSTLRHYEGLDFFKRAKDVLDIGYLNKPIFFYRQREDSMSHTNLRTRAKVKKQIEARK